MLEVFIIMYLMKQEGSQCAVNSVSGSSLVSLREDNNIPKGTFYRAVNQLLDMGVIVKQKKDWYVLAQDYRGLCNKMKNASVIWNVNYA